MSDDDLVVNFEEIDRLKAEEAAGLPRAKVVELPPRKSMISFDAPFPVFKDRCGGEVRAKPDLCEINGCGRPATCLDHCHRTGRFRGWVCHSCNSRLRVFGYTEEVLKYCAYLVRFAQTIPENPK
jgi:hypothetical protein